MRAPFYVCAAPYKNGHVRVTYYVCVIFNSCGAEDSHVAFDARVTIDTSIVR
jgi:hypothetical protein